MEIKQSSKLVKPFFFCLPFIFHSISRCKHIVPLHLTDACYTCQLQLECHCSMASEKLDKAYSCWYKKLLGLFFLFFCKAANMHGSLRLMRQLIFTSSEVKQYSEIMNHTRRCGSVTVTWGAAEESHTENPVSLCRPSAGITAELVLCSCYTGCQSSKGHRHLCPVLSRGSWETGSFKNQGTSLNTFNWGKSKIHIPWKARQTQGLSQVRITWS